MIALPAQIAIPDARPYGQPGRAGVGGAPAPHPGERPRRVGPRLGCCGQGSHGYRGVGRTGGMRVVGAVPDHGRRGVPAVLQLGVERHTGTCLCGRKIRRLAARSHRGDADLDRRCRNLQHRICAMMVAGLMLVGSSAPRRKLRPIQWQGSSGKHGQRFPMPATLSSTVGSIRSFCGSDGNGPRGTASQLRQGQLNPVGLVACIDGRGFRPRCANRFRLSKTLTPSIVQVFKVPGRPLISLQITAFSQFGTSFA